MKKFISVFLAVALLVLALAACEKDPVAPSETPSETVQTSETPAPTAVTPPAPTAPTAPTAPPTDEPPAAEMPDNSLLTSFWERMDGSTATIPLTAAIYGRISGGEWPPVHNATPMAYYNLINGYSDLIFVTYPSANEFAEAKEKGIELEIIPVVKDALVFLVNKDNPVNNITVAQLRDVYTGKTTNWSAVGGANEPIIPYQRSEDSGSQTLFLKLLMDGTAPMKAPSEWVPESMGSLVESVSYYDNAKSAMGYSMFYYVNNMYGNSQFKLLSVDGVVPNRDTIISGSYPLGDCYYAVLRKSTPADSPLRKLIDWLLTDDGQELAAGAGYIPMRPLASDAPGAIDPVYLGDTINSSGTGGKVLKASADDIVNNSVRRPLSDVFFDGFNYVQFINGKIMENLNRINNEFFRTTNGDEVLMTAFTGIPNDYPNFEIVDDSWSGYRYIYINFPNGNPFFKPWDHASNSRLFNIRLTEDISPYGIGLEEFSVTYDYDRMIMDNARLFTLRISMPGSPSVADRINVQLKAWTDTFPGDGAAAATLRDFCDWCEYKPDYPCSVQPSYGTWRNYFSVSYIPSRYDGPIFDMPLLFTICFDMNTGDVVNLADTLPGDFGYMNLHVPVSFAGFGANEFPRPEYMDEGYEPKPGSVVTSAWIVDRDGYLLVKEPGGRVLQGWLGGLVD